MNFLSVALKYTELGFYVLPIVPRARRPLCPQGEHNATRDSATIRGWARQFADADVAVVPGLSNHFVLDVDVRNEGDLTMEDLPPLPETPMTLTGGGGYHLWLQRTEKLRHLRIAGLKIDGLRKSGIDIKGLQSGYVVVPPSSHPFGTRYHWEAVRRVSEVPIAEPPDWLVRTLMVQSPRPVKARALDHTFSFEHPVDPESFFLGRLFRANGTLGPQFKPGIFAVRCPTEFHHSGGQPFDRSTMIFAPHPKHSKRRGQFYCHHSSFCTEHWQ